MTQTVVGQPTVAVQAVQYESARREHRGDACRDGKEIASLNNDLKVNSTDQLLAAQSYGYAPGPPYVVAFDVNKDGVINSTDLLIAAQLTGYC